LTSPTKTNVGGRSRCIAKGDKAKRKAEDFYITAGQHLKELKAQHDDAGGTWAEWEIKVKERTGLGKSRASELMQIADGRKNVEQIREGYAKANAKRNLPAKPSMYMEKTPLSPRPPPKPRRPRPSPRKSSVS
jgi:hypothetical protein